jgi:glyoxylase-like metal-dependent hydrolase (beta-lactamase superfamily II)
MRAIKNLFILVIILAVIGAGAVGAFRVARGRPAAADQIKPNMVATSAGGVSVYAARVGSHVIVFDASADPQGRPIDAAAAALGAGHGDVSDIFITHAHGDHTSGAAAFGGAKVHLGSADVAAAEKKAPQVPPAAQIMSKAMSFPAITVTDPLSGVATVDVGDGKSVKAFPVPGHTPGSYAFLYDGVLFAGDTMVFKQGRLDRPPKLLDADRGGARRALEELKKQLEGTDLDMICTGHGGCTPKGLGKNLFDDFVSRLTD